MHTGGGRERVNIVTPPPSHISKHLLIKMDPLALFPESLDPPGDFGKKHQVPPPRDFQPVYVYASGYILLV